MARIGTLIAPFIARRTEVETQLEIMVLDDEEIVCARLKPALEKEGYRIETFTNSQAAKRRLEEKKFDLVVTDLKMAEIDGLALLRFVREKWPGTRVIIISGFATVDVTREAFQAGVYDVIAKPFKIGQLKNLIKRVAAEIKSPGT
jgi:DNA-binding NtrC family response regulator